MILTVHSMAALTPLKDPSLTLRMTRGRDGAARRRSFAYAQDDPGEGRGLVGGVLPKGVAGNAG